MSIRLGPTIQNLVLQQAQKQNSIEIRSVVSNM